MSCPQVICPAIQSFFSLSLFLPLSIPLGRQGGVAAHLSRVWALFRSRFGHADFAAASRHNFAKDSLGLLRGREEGREGVAGKGPGFVVSFHQLHFGALHFTLPHPSSLSSPSSLHSERETCKKMLSPFSILGPVVILIVVYWACQMRTSVPWPAWQPCQCLQACRVWCRETGKRVRGSLERLRCHPSWRTCCL